MSQIVIIVLGIFILTWNVLSQMKIFLGNPAGGEIHFLKMLFTQGNFDHRSFSEDHRVKTEALILALAILLMIAGFCSMIAGALYLIFLPFGANLSFEGVWWGLLLFFGVIWRVILDDIQEEEQKKEERKHKISPA